MHAVTATALTLRLGGRTILSGVHLAIQEGAFIGMLGPNGAGKTTLIRAILGLVRPTSGTLQVFGRPATRGNPAIGYMPQSRTSTGTHLTGWDFVASAANGHRWGLPVLSPQTRAAVHDAIALVGGESLAERPLRTLSGGERQRLLLAQALLGRPRLLLLDEPLISLDPANQDAAVRLVRDVQRRLGAAVLFAAHEINPILPALDQVLYLGHGRAALGAVQDVMTAPVLSALYGAQIDVVHAAGRIFVMAGAYDLEASAHAHEHHHHGHPGA